MSAAEAVIALRRFRFSGSVMARFFGKRTARAGALWGLAFGLVTYTSAVGFFGLGDAVQRAQILGTLSSNVGIKVLLGTPYKIFDVGGFIDWRITGLAAIVGAIWAILTATKTFRGEETAGRWELFLSGQVTARRAAANALIGLGAGLLAFFAMVASLTLLTTLSPQVDFAALACLSYALALTAGAAMFMAIGAFTSQLMPIRARAATMAGGIFGLSFVLHGIAGITDSAHWLLYVSPLGWIELLHPLTDPAPMWYLPIVGVIVLFGTLTVVMAGRRDLYASTFADKDSAKPKTRLLNSPLLAAFRLTRASIFGWLGAITVLGFLYGSFAKAAAKVFTSQGIFRKFGGQLFHQAQTQGVKTYAGFVGLILMMLMMVYVASAIGRMREDESEGYVDNLLVRAVARLSWFVGRALLVLGVIAAAGLLAATAMWAGQATGHVSLPFPLLLQGGINMMAPATLVFGIALFVLGVAPRLTTIVGYGVVAGSFLIQMVGSAVNLNHWIVDLSILRHIALAPAMDVNWRVVSVYVASGLVLAAIGAWRFCNRDLQTE